MATEKVAAVEKNGSSTSIRMSSEARTRARFTEDEKNVLKAFKDSCKSNIARYKIRGASPDEVMELLEERKQLTSTLKNAIDVENYMKALRNTNRM